MQYPPENCNRAIASATVSAEGRPYVSDANLDEPSPQSSGSSEQISISIGRLSPEGHYYVPSLPALQDYLITRGLHLTALRVAIVGGPVRIAREQLLHGEIKLEGGLVGDVAVSVYDTNRQPVESAILQVSLSGGVSAGDTKAWSYAVRKGHATVPLAALGKVYDLEVLSVHKKETLGWLRTVFSDAGGGHATCEISLTRSEK